MTKVNKVVDKQNFFLLIMIGYSRQKRRKGKNKGQHTLPKAGSDNKHSKEENHMTSGHKTSVSDVEEWKKPHLGLQVSLEHLGVNSEHWDSLLNPLEVAWAHQ